MKPDGLSGLIDGALQQRLFTAFGLALAGLEIGAE